MLLCIKTNIFIEQSDLIRSVTPTFLQKMKENVEIKDEEILETGNYRKSDVFAKDCFVINRRGVIILTNRRFIAIEEESDWKLKKFARPNKTRRNKANSAE